MTTVEPAALLAYLGAQRWFAGDSAHAEIAEHRVLDWVRPPGSGLGVRVELVTVVADGTPTTYHLPMSYRAERLEQLEHSRIGPAVLSDDEVTWHGYDAVHDHEAVAALLAGFVTPRDGGGGLEYQQVSDLGLVADAPTVLLTGEQSNTSLVVDERAMLKLFRRVSPGRNPDVEVLGALAEDYSDIVPQLYGWISTVPHGDEEAYDLAILQAYLRTATEGWESARASVRDLLASPGMRPEDAGGDFAGEAERLGEATRRVHDGMARLLPTAHWGTDELDALADRFSQHFERAVTLVADLGPRRDGVLAAFDAVRTREAPVRVQRVHGDLHLGQTLRTSIGWRLIDFEGEPARPLAERTRLDSALRDVAGMLRSFDYAAQTVLNQVGDVERGQRAANAWTAYAQQAFLRGYGPPLSSEDATLLRAYEVHKAVYEVLYEAHHRPGWIDIPLRVLPS